MSCNAYIDQHISEESECNVIATFRYAVENIGLACIEIDAARITMGSDGDRDLSLAGVDVYFCPNDVVVFVEKRSIDLCSNAGQTLQIELKLEDGSNTVTADAVLPFNSATTHRPSPMPKTNSPTVAPTKSPIKPATKAPVSSPVLSPSSQPEKQVSIECTASPNKVWFLFKIKRCEESDNSQFARKRREIKVQKPSKGGLSTKFKSNCVDYCPVLPAAKLVVTSQSGSHMFFNDRVYEDEVVEIIPGTATVGTVKVDIYTLGGRISQSFTVDLSCAKGLWIGDNFGSLELVGFENDEQGVVN